MELLSSDNVIAIVAVVLLIIPILYTRFARGGTHDLPPGPVGLPILGNLPQLGDLPHRTLKKMADKYGDIMFLRLGSVPTVVVSSYEKAMLFLKNHDLVFASRRITTAGDIMFKQKVVLVSPYGDLWRRMRKLCVTEMLSPKRVESFKHIRQEQVEALIWDLWEASGQGSKAVNMSVAIGDVGSKVSLRMVTGRTYKGDSLQLADGSTLVFKTVLHDGGKVLGSFNIGDFIPFLNVFDLQGIRKKARQVKKTLDYIFEQMIEDHLQHPLPADADHAKDFVDVLLEMLHENPGNATMENVKCMMLDMYGAAAETTTATLEWLISEVARNPKVMSKLQQEIETVVAKNGGKLAEKLLPKMTYLNSVIKETLRLHPSVGLGVPHESTQEVIVDGFRIPEKTQVIFNLWAIGTDPRFWENAEEFDPARFTTDESMDLAALSSEYKMLPFSAGRRGCPGAAMVAPMLRLCLAALFFAFDWTLPPQEDGGVAELDMSESSGITVARKQNLMLVPRLRHVSRLALIHE